MSFNYDSSTVTGIMHGGGGGTAVSYSARDGIEMVQLNRYDINSDVVGRDGASMVVTMPPTPTRTPSKKILTTSSSSNTNQQQQTPKKQLQFSTPECNTVVPPSPTISMISPKIMLPNRKREEAIVMANLRKKVPAFDLTRRRPVSGEAMMNNNDIGGSTQQLDNRPTSTTMPKISSKTGISLMDPNNNNCNTSYEDTSSVKAATSIGMQDKDKDFILELLCWHNEYRARHAVTALSISSELCEYAQTWANHLASINEFYYRSDKSIGQNLFCCPVSALVTDLTGQEVASFWYSTVRKYNYYKQSHLLHTNVNAGHFAQMVWASSRYLGVGKASSKTGKIFVVAFYFPPGNVVDSYHVNVPPPIVEQDMAATGSSPKMIDVDNNPMPSILKP